MSNPTPEFRHAPVLLEPILEIARNELGGRAGVPLTLVDATVGGAGHATRLLELLPAARLIGVDRDPQAVAVARERLARFGTRAQVLHGPFSELPTLLSELGVRHVDLLLADLGVSSHQLDTAGRGFSFMRPGPLDMRMDPSQGETAAELIGRLDLDTLTAALRDLGEERYARPVARTLLEHKPQSTEAAAELIRRVVPRGSGHIDPATRTFQGLRLLVNRELDELDALLEAAPEILADRGVGLFISFHSLEDRAVKQALRRQAHPCVCPPGLPECMCGRVARLRLLSRKAIVADDLEVATNPRARSAKLRAAARLERPS